MHEKIAIELQQMWRENLGVEIQLRQAEWKVFLSAQRRIEYDLSRSSWVGDYNDPNTFLEIMLSDSGNNRTGWTNAQYDLLIHEANGQRDASRRADLFRQAESILLEEAPIIPLYHYRGLNYYDGNRIGGIHPNPMDVQPIRAIYLRPAAKSALD